MSIANFADLRTQIASWLNRTDLTTAQLSLFVATAESDIRNDVETRESELLATGTMLGDGFLAPTGYLSTRTLVVDGHFYSYLTPEQYAAKVDAESTERYYTVNGDAFSVIGGDGLDYELLYLGEVTALVADGDSNWILANAPTIYLWAGCKYGAVFLRDPGGATGYDTLYKEAVSRLNMREREAKYAGPLVVRVA
jgi:hypothetical protein